MDRGGAGLFQHFQLLDIFSLMAKNSIKHLSWGIRNSFNVSVFIGKTIIYDINFLRVLE